MPATTSSVVSARPSELAPMNSAAPDRLGEQHEDGALVDLLAHQRRGDEHGHDEAEERHGDAGRSPS